MTLRLHDTLTRQKQEFRPIDPAAVRLYVCGPTVYDFAHIGNARPVIVFDVLFRLLRHLHGEKHVFYARNITDVDDKINARAVERWPEMAPNDAIRRLTVETQAQYDKDVAALGCLPPTAAPRATEHIPAMRALIERLVQRGFAYVAADHVLFSPTAMNAAGGDLPRYGAFARRSLDDMIAGARVDVAPYKRDPMDFVLWKPSGPAEPGWPSPAGITGPGRPGWHIECSAMSMATLLEPFGGGLSCDDPTRNRFDIHGGGIDLVFPHHENEIAQTCCALGVPRMADIWMHNGFLQVEGEKMSKSLGNFVTIRELLETDAFGGTPWHGGAIRAAMLMTHYRQPMDWTVARLVGARKELMDWAEIAYLVPAKDAAPPPEMLEALGDDLNTHEALTVARSLFKRASGSGERDAHRAFAGAIRLLGLYRGEKATEFAIGFEAKSAPTAAIVEPLLAARAAARAAKSWADADRIRAELDAMGIVIMDVKDGPTTWEVRR